MVSEASGSWDVLAWNRYLNREPPPQKERKWKTFVAQEHLKIHIWKAFAICCFVFASKTENHKSIYIKMRKTGA